MHACIYNSCTQLLLTPHDSAVRETLLRESHDVPKECQYHSTYLLIATPKFASFDDLCYVAFSPEHPESRCAVTNLRVTNMHVIARDITRSSLMVSEPCLFSQLKTVPTTR